MVPAFASESKEKITFSAVEITDIKEINHRLMNNITDDDSLKGNITLDKQIIKGDDGKEYKIVPRKVKITSQKVKETVKDNGDKTTSYVAYVLAEVSVTPMASGGGTEEPYDYDDSYSTATYVRVTYEYNHFTRNLVEYYLFKFTSVSGKIVRLDPAIILSKLVVNNSANGDYYSDSSANNWVGRGGLTTGKTFSYPDDGTYYSITTLTYYFNTACGGTGVAFIRAEATAYVSRGGTSWNYKVSLNKTN